MLLRVGIQNIDRGRFAVLVSIQRPNIREFPLMGFASRIVSSEMAQDSLVPALAPLANTSEFRRDLEVVRMLLGEVWNRRSWSTEGQIGISTQSAEWRLR